MQDFEGRSEAALCRSHNFVICLLADPLCKPFEPASPPTFPGSRGLNSTKQTRKCFWGNAFNETELGVFYKWFVSLLLLLLLPNNGPLLLHSLFP